VGQSVYASRSAFTPAFLHRLWQKYSLQANPGLSGVQESGAHYSRSETLTSVNMLTTAMWKAAMKQHSKETILAPVCKMPIFRERLLAGV